MKSISNIQKHTSFTVGSTDLDGSQVVEKLLKICVTQLWSPGRDWSLMEPVKDKRRIIKKSGQYYVFYLTTKVSNLGRIYKH